MGTQICPDWSILTGPPLAHDLPALTDQGVNKQAFLPFCADLVKVYRPALTHGVVPRLDVQGCPTGWLSLVHVWMSLVYVWLSLVVCHGGHALSLWRRGR